MTFIHGSHPVAPSGVAATVPFDVTPAELITGIIKERGIFKPGELAGAFGTSRLRSSPASFLILASGVAWAHCYAARALKNLRALYLASTSVAL